MSTPIPAYKRDLPQYVKAERKRRSNLNAVRRHRERQMSDPIPPSTPGLRNIHSRIALKKRRINQLKEGLVETEQTLLAEEKRQDEEIDRLTRRVDMAAQLDDERGINEGQDMDDDRPEEDPKEPV